MEGSQLKPRPGYKGHRIFDGSRVRWHFLMDTDRTKEWCELSSTGGEVCRRLAMAALHAVRKQRNMGSTLAPRRSEREHHPSLVQKGSEKNPRTSKKMETRQIMN
jgi:hypothetical protein